ncbi:glycerol kinase GlpK [Caenispirillum bisanense]|uniref:glycerol kinase GlpK n=1 Tax=Caenispirillum bisanense TaxID=414052 RepID=UPI0031E2759A
MHILAIDQGTTSSRAIVFDADGQPLAVAQREFPQHYPAPGWVEHDPEDIWTSTVACVREVLERAGDQVGAIGVTNQRETTVVWDRRSGRPLHNAIVWQDRRTADTCHRLREAGVETEVTQRSGLIVDPYFSATKAAWVLDHVEGARLLAQQGDLCFGTIDSFLIWRLTGGRRHVTDATNACRTALFNLRTQDWDDALCDIFRVPRAMLPQVLDSAADFGTTDPDTIGRALPILGVAGDQQAAAVGQACFTPGTIKSTYGTGCFVILNTGDTPIESHNRLLTTVCYRLNGRPTYAIEGSIFVSGAAVQWLRDKLGLIRSAAETEAIAAALPDNRGVYLVPAFTGLGAPHWVPEARGALSGLTRDTGRDEIVRATLEAVAYQTRDLFQAMAQDGMAPQTLRVDGGMAVNDWLMQFLADTLDVPVDRPRVTETTALGAAYLAGLQAGLYTGLDDIAGRWGLDARFTPAMAAETRRRNLAGWDKAVGRVAAP